MPISISIFERTGSTPYDEEVFNCNWKDQGLRDSLYKYYYYPIRKPETEPFSYSVTKYLYAKIEGTYSVAKRARWKVVGFPMSDTDLFIGHSQTYATPTTTPKTDLIYGGRTPYYLYPNLSTSSPASATTRINTLSSDTTYYTDFLITQLRVKQGSAPGNSDVIGFRIELDEYE